MKTGIDITSGRLPPGIEGFRMTDENDGSGPRMTCPITAHPCEGDLSYLCEEYGCLRKGGLSPHSEENQSPGS